MELTERFEGMEINYRRQTSAPWPKHWRVRLITNKNERQEYRITVFGDTENDARNELKKRVSALDLLLETERD